MFERFTLITGPCVLENDELNLEIADIVEFVDTFDESDLFFVVNRIICQCDARLSGDAFANPDFAEGVADYRECFTPLVEGEFDGQILATFYPEIDGYLLWEWDDEDEEWSLYEGQMTGDIVFAQFPNDEDTPAVGYYWMFNEQQPHFWIELVDAIEDGLVDEDDVPEQSRRLIDPSLLEKNGERERIRRGRERILFQRKRQGEKKE